MDHKESFHTGIFYMLLSAASLSVVGLLARLGMAELTLQGLIFWRFFTAFILFFFLLWFRGQLKEKLSFGDFKLQFIRPIFTLGAQYSFYYYIDKNTLLNATALLNTGALFIPLIEWSVLGRRVGKSTWIGVVVSFAGVLCILQPDAGIFSLLSLIGLLSGFCQGASQVVLSLGSKNEKPDLALLYLFFFCALFSLFPLLFADEGFGIVKQGGDSLIFLILSLGLISVLNQTTRATAYKHGSASRLSPFLYFSAIPAGIFDWAIFGNIPNLLSLLGVFLVIGGGLLKYFLHIRHVRKTENK